MTPEELSGIETRTPSPRIPAATPPVTLPRPSNGKQPPPPPAARLFHSTPLIRGAQPAVPFVPARPRFEANAGLRFAQLAILTQTVLAVITAVGLLRGSMKLVQLGSGVTLSSSASLAGNYGKGIAVIAGVLLLGVVTVSLPSQIVRGLLSVLEIVMLGVTLAAHFGGGSVLGFVTVLTMGASGGAIISFAGVVALQSVTIFFLAMHPPTYRAFSEGRAPLTWAT